jgi:hypothetical protein
MTGNALDADSIRRDHDGKKVGFCSEDCAKKWDAMTLEERATQLAGK